MMNDLFFRKHSKHHVPRHQRPTPKHVPVQFMSHEQQLKHSAAVKIQKVFRGYTVRKNVKKIVSVKTEVCEVERRIEDTEVVELIRRDNKERLRVNETLMSLLLKLDSVRGVDFGVKELRKVVTRRVVALQEKVDSIGQ